MMRVFIAGLRLSSLFIVALVSNFVHAKSENDKTLVFSDLERKRIMSLSPLPPPPVDVSNQYVDNEQAIQLGRTLFFDTKFSASGTMSCATCHNPKFG